MVKVYIEKHYNDVVFTQNPLNRALEGGEFLVFGELSGVVDRNTAIGDNFGFQIDSFMEIQVNEENLAAQVNAYAEGKPLFFNQTTGEFADATASGFVKVGQIAHNRLADEGIITFFKYPLAG